MLTDIESTVSDAESGNIADNLNPVEDEPELASSTGEPAIKRQCTDVVKKEAFLFTDNPTLSTNCILSNIESTLSAVDSNSTAAAAAAIPLTVPDIALPLPSTPDSSLLKPSSPHVKRKRADLTPKIKKEICLYKESNPTITQNNVCLYAQNILGVRIGRSTVCDILKDKEKWIALGDIAVSTRIRRPKHEELENALSAWYADMTAGDPNMVISDDILRDQAKLLGKQLGIEDFQYSNGWLSRFKARRGLHLARMERAAKCAAMEDSTSTSSATDQQKDMNYLLAAYSPDNVYYCEAIDLDYRLEWHVNRSRDNIGLLLCTSITGGDKRTPLVVWRRQRARCFGHAFDPNQLCDWRVDESSKLTASLFSEWLSAFDADCQKLGRRILLLCNLSANLLINSLPVSNITPCHLPTWQLSIDSSDSFPGLHENFRCLVGFQQLSRLFEDIEEERWPPGMDVKQALYCIRDAWSDFRIEILIERLQSCGLNVGGNHRPVDHFDFERRFNTALGHVSDFSQSVMPESTPDPSNLEDQDDSEEPIIVSSDEARKAVDSLMLFMEQHLGDGSNQFSVHDLDCLRSAKRRCLALKREEMRREKLPSSSASRQIIKTEFPDFDS